MAWGGLAWARYSGCVTQPAPVHLILGEDDFLTERARRDIIDAIKKTSADPGAVGIITMRASDLTEGEVAMHLSPSLFGEERILVITNAEDTIKDAHDALLLAARNDQPGIYVIIQHTGKGRAKNMVKALSKLGVVHDAAKLIAAIARLYSARSVGEAKDRAGVVKMPPWKIESTYKKARRWDGDNISKAVIIIAELDAATKGQGGDPGYAIENAVRQIAELAP